MTQSLPLLTQFITGLTAISANLFAVCCKPALAAATLSPALSNYLPVESGSASTTQPAGFIYGRVRRSTQRVIIEWQTRHRATTGNFAIYRGRTLTWREARPLDLSIFATADEQATLTTYRAVDTTAPLPDPYYYWIVDLSAKRGEWRYGPYCSSGGHGG